MYKAMGKKCLEEKNKMNEESKIDCRYSSLFFDK